MSFHFEDTIFFLVQYISVSSASIILEEEEKYMTDALKSIIIANLISKKVFRYSQKKKNLSDERM